MSQLALQELQRPKNRVRDIRVREGITLRTIHRRMGLTLSQARHLDDPRTDLRLSELYQLAQIFDVPPGELLATDDEFESGVSQVRGQLLRMVKTIRSLQEQAPNKTIQRLTETLRDILLRAFPEMQEVLPWHAIGRRRTGDDLGRIGEEPVETDPYLRETIAAFND